MSRIRVTGGALLASAAILGLSVGGAQRAGRRFMDEAKAYIETVTAPVTDMDRPDHRPEGAGRTS